MNAHTPDFQLCITVMPCRRIWTFARNASGYASSKFSNCTVHASGQAILTLMPSLPHSVAATRVNPRIPSVSQFLSHGYRMKFVLIFSSVFGSSTPAFFPASRHFSIHAIFLPKTCIIWSPSASRFTSSGVFPCTIAQ